MSNGVARPSRKAFRALSRAGYVVRTRGARTTVVGKTIKQRKTFLGLGYTARVRVPWTPPWKRK